MKRLLFLCLWVGLPAHAWDHHDWITQAALQSVTLANAAVEYEPLETALRRPQSEQELRTSRAFLEKYQLNKEYVFSNKLEETPGRAIFVKSILSMYADEPDWGADQELFEADQYPELWTADTPYISQRSGLGSQGFRHMFFPGTLNWWEPISSFQIPLHAIGEAPKRAQVFFELAQQMSRAGADYWHYRFLAWALHYVQDLFQPFHSRQTPSKHFIQFRLKWWVLPSIDIEATADQIAYYHLGYEAWVSRQFRQTEALASALGQGSLPEKVSLPPGSYAERVVVPYAASKATELGDLLRSVLPKPTPVRGAKPKDTIGTESWWKAVQTGEKDKALLEISAELFGAMGKVTRHWVQAPYSGDSGKE